MKKIYLWGVGKGCEKALHNLKQENVDILGFIDNNPATRGKPYRDWKILSFDQIQEDFDYIIVTVIQYKAILFQLEKESVDANKIICYYNMEHCNAGKGNLLKEEAWKIDLLEQRISDLERMTNIRMNNIGHEIIDKVEKGKYKQPIIRSGLEAINRIVNENKSLIRFGDGEFEIMAGKNRPIFQRYSEELAKRLQDVIQSKDDRILIAIANNYGDLDIYTDEVADAIREYMTEEVRMFHNSVLQTDKKYYDAYMFKSYFPYKDKSGTPDRVAQIKRIWDKRNVVLIEGDKTRTGCGNDLLDNVQSIQRILCPTIDAFAVYDEILEEAVKVEKDRLILLTLGPTAKVLAYDLVQEGYQVVDIGQIDMDYEWYQAGKEIRVPIDNKYVSQLPPAYVGEWQDAQYKAQIIARIGGEYAN